MAEQLWFNERHPEHPVARLFNALPALLKIEAVDRRSGGEPFLFVLEEMTLEYFGRLPPAV
ncbi:hypothetical protein ACFC1T_27345 [Kitasatospora sp. NPDC056076]|uniref:hypothetical protein n=1 Tax=Kitasatospora sp. NPDC056076 TaxID=3345703 RepID=UPI0035E015B3